MFIHPSPFLSTSRVHGRHAQSGVVLIIALIMLVIISLMAAMNVRNATSSEAVNANVRQSQLASQAAETALRYCEDATINMINSGTATFSVTSPPSLSTATFSVSYVQDIVVGTPTSMIASNWDSTTASNKILVMPVSTVNRSGTTFSRPPECMVERLAPSTSTAYSKSFNVTARGFGPEVSAADSTRSRPLGSEVWLQSSLEFE